MRTARRSPALGAMLALLGLLLSAPRPRAAVAALRDASTAGDPTAPLVAALALLAWLLAGWLLVTAALTLLARVPGTTGRASAAAVRRVAPTALRRLVGAVLGVSVVAGALSATPASADPTSQPPATAAAPASLDWPAGPELDWPGPRPADTAASAVDRTDGASAAPVLGATTRSGKPADAVVVVQPGDTLWRLAERALADQQQAAPTDQQVAASWPAWWSANREAVGDDPDLLLPATRLDPPPTPDPG